jgi:hypothetical protein
MSIWVIFKLLGSLALLMFGMKSMSEALQKMAGPQLRHVLGAMTTDRFHNYCFEIQLSDEITYTYRLSEGVARNQNATYLLKNVLKSALGCVSKSG